MIGANVNLANLLTLSRFCATPFVIWLMYGSSAAARYGALALFLGAMATDVFDGLLARNGRGTALGNYLDPVADKTLILSAFVALGALRVLPLWMGLVLIAREFAVSAVRDVAAAKGRVIGANWMGKTKTVLQVVTVAWAMLYHARAAEVKYLVASEADRQALLDYYSFDRTLLWAFALLTVVASVVFAGAFAWWHRRLLFHGNPPVGGPTSRQDTKEGERHDTSCD